MKCQVTKAEGNYIEILCPANKFTAGQFVEVEDAATGTSQQNKLFHKLITLWQTSGCCSYTGNLKEVKDYIKRDYGEGFEYYIYADDACRLVKVKDFYDVPKSIRDDHDRINGKLLSWADYTKVQRKNCISNVIAVMIESGVNSKEFDEICKELI